MLVPKQSDSDVRQVYNTYVGDRPSLTLLLRDSFFAAEDTPALDFRRNVGVDAESAADPSDASVILLRLRGFVSRVFCWSLSIDLRFFAGTCPESRSEALRLGVVVVGFAAGFFVRVACSFFQLLESPLESIPTAKMCMND